LKVCTGRTAPPRVKEDKGMEVTIVNRSESTGAVISCPKIAISDNCPKCGGERGKPSGFNFWEDGTSHWCQRWRNPCGHIDLYEDCLKEAKGAQGG